MPRFDYRCYVCRSIEEKWQKIAELDKITQWCPRCHVPMIRLISAPSINPDYEPYLEENMGDKPVEIKSRQHRKEELKKRRLHDGWGVGL